MSHEHLHTKYTESIIAEQMIHVAIADYIVL